MNLVDVQEDQIVCTKCDKLQRLVIQEGVHASDPEFPFSGGRVFEASNRVMEVSHTVRRSGLKPQTIFISSMLGGVDRPREANIK